MAMQAGVQTSKVLILLGAGVSGSIVLRHGRLSDLIAQLQDLLKGAEVVGSTPYKYDGALLAAQAMHLTWFQQPPLELWGTVICGGRCPSLENLSIFLCCTCLLLEFCNMQFFDALYIFHFYHLPTSYGKVEKLCSNGKVEKLCSL